MLNNPVIRPNDNRPFYKKKRFIIPGALLFICFLGAQIDSGKTDKGLVRKREKTSHPAGTDTLDMKTIIENNIKSLKEDDLTKTPIENTTDLAFTAAIFTAYAQTIKEGKASNDASIVLLTEQLEKKVIASQLKNFPLIRKAYYKIVKEKLWEEDVYVDLMGRDYSTLQFTGSYFAANKNIKETQTALSEMLKLLRFKRVQYRWYKEQDSYTYYTIASAKDGDIVE